MNSTFSIRSAVLGRWRRTGLVFPRSAPAESGTNDNGEKDGILRGHLSRRRQGPPPRAGSHGRRARMVSSTAVISRPPAILSGQPLPTLNWKHGGIDAKTAMTDQAPAADFRTRPGVDFSGGVRGATRLAAHVPTGPKKRAWSYVRYSITHDFVVLSLAPSRPHRRVTSTSPAFSCRRTTTPDELQGLFGKLRR